MKTSSVVIGANYGDEGKGLITDYEVRRANAKLVVRFNGGAQAGHTVTTEDGRHVFGHIGAGTFAGALTWLGSKFIVNPHALLKEQQELRGLGISPTIYYNPRARVSTLFDMAINSLVELKRGNNRHGSCGMGINETVTRHAYFPLTVADLNDNSVVRVSRTLRAIRDEWVPARLKELGIEEVVEPYASILNMKGWLYDMTEEMMDAVRSYPLQASLPTVFEGAQGLALDEFLGEFPHVTRSITGLPYAIAEADELGIQRLQPIYVTRAYLTRHGAGPLPNDGMDIGLNVEDKTNVHNEWQGSIRYAPLHLQLLQKSIFADQQRSVAVAQAHNVEVAEPTIAITCLDQLPETVTFVDLNGTISKCRREEFPHLVQRRLRYNVTHLSYGPKNTDVQFFRNGV